VTGFWPIFFLLVVLKIPVLASMWLVYWAAKQHDEPEAATDEDSGGFKRRPRPAARRSARRWRGAAGGRLPARRADPGRQAGCATRFRSRRISRR
jgi:hypothetical protein